MLSRQKILVVILTFFWGASTQVNAFSENSGTNNLPWLKTSGRWIVDENGNFVLLRGADYMGMEFGWFYHSEDDFARMKSWGFNVVRLPIAWRYVEPREGYYDDNYLAIVDRVISWCKENNLYVILDMHQWNWAPKFGGNGLPDWAVEQYSDQDQAKIGFFKNETLQDEFFNMWRHVADRYKNESTVFAYDILNEPNVNYELMSEKTFLERLRSFYQNAANSIREVDIKHAVMIEPPWGGGINDWARINDSNLVLSTHLYTEGTADGTTGYDGDSSKLEADFLVSHNLSISWNVPLVIGEFGVGSAATRAHEWTRDFMNIFDKYMVSACWWSYWRDDNSMGLLTSKGEEKENLLSALVRIYPCRFNYVPQKFTYDIYTNMSETEWYLGTEDSIEIAFKIPPRMVGNLTKSSNFTSASFSLDQDTSELRVTLRGQGEGYLEVGEKLPEYPTIKANSKPVFQDPIFIVSLALNIMLILIVIVLRHRHMH
jgi:aryl-phospho-beta-D-glucosidase BglC (GH1 family)